MARVWTFCTFEPWADSLIANAPGRSKLATTLEVELVVPAGAEVVDRAAEEAELDAALDQQREVGEREGLEARDRRADHAEAAELLGEEQRRAARLGECRGPLGDLLAVLLRGERLVGLLEARVREDGADVLAHHAAARRRAGS